MQFQNSINNSTKCLRTDKYLSTTSLIICFFKYKYITSINIEGVDFKNKDVQTFIIYLILYKIKNIS